MSSFPHRRTYLSTAHERFLADRNQRRFEKTIRQFYSPETLTAILFRGSAPMRMAAATGLGFVGDARSLDDLGQALSDSERCVRLVADLAFHELLIRSVGTKDRKRLRQVVRLNEIGEHAAALAPALILADQAPQHAEVHYQVAVCWDGLDEFDTATEAYSACVDRCRHHYPAWLGLARCRIMQGDLNGAIEVLDRALEVSPDLEAARSEAIALRRKTRQDSAE